MSKKNTDITDAQNIQLENTLTNAQKREAEELKHKRTAKIYGLAVVALLIVAVGAVIWNGGYFQKNTNAATVNGQDISVAELAYYYNTVMQDEMYNAYYYGTSGYDYTVAAASQMYDDTTTYHDYFLSQALVEMQSVYGLLQSADEAGFTVDQATMDSDWATTVASLESYAYSYGLTSAESYLQYNYGSYMTLDAFEKIFEDQNIASLYASAIMEDFTPSEGALEEYYEANAADLDTYTIDYMVILATADTTDADGEALSDEEIAASLEANRTSAEADANAIVAALDAGEDFVSLGEDYEVYGAYEGDQYMGQYLNTTFSDWVMEDSRQAGDTTITTYESTDRYVYYVVRFQDCSRDDSETATIRHIFLSAGYTPTEEEMDAAYDSAQDILTMWEEDGSSVDYFAELAYYYSADTSSSSSGGQIAGVGETSGYVDTFTDWCLDESRYVGETGLVINEDSDQKGWHIMYFEERTGAQWELIAEAAILTADMTAWHDALVASIPAQLESGSKYVG